MAYQKKIIQGDNPDVIKLYGERTAKTSCQYLLPYVSPSSNILDVGCGPGLITSDLANLAPHGKTIGIDNSSGVIAQATASFCSSHPVVPNLKFQVADAMDLKEFDDNTFDIVHSHQLLVHISSPVTLLKEFLRVCKPGGVIACRESSSAVILSIKPDLPGIREYWAKVVAMMPLSGAQPEAGLKLEEWGREAGFAGRNGKGKILVSKSPIWNAGHLSQVTGEAADRFVGLGMATREEMDRWAEAWREWEGSEGHEFVLETGEMLCWKEV